MFSAPAVRQKTKAQEAIAEVKSDRNLFSRLYVASQVRDGNLEEFFLMKISHAHHHYQTAANSGRAQNQISFTALKSKS